MNLPKIIQGGMGIGVSNWVLARAVSAAEARFSSGRTAAEWEEVFGIPIRQGYGLTEASPVCLFNGPQHPNRPGTLGYPVPRVDVSIQDDDGSVLPDGEVGEICVRGENVFGGYLDGERLGEPPFRGEWRAIQSAGSGTICTATSATVTSKSATTASASIIYYLAPSSPTGCAQRASTRSTGGARKPATTRRPGSACWTDQPQR